MSSRRTEIALFLASEVLLALQLAIMHALAYSQGHHFAYVVISLALLGFGSGGTVLALARDWFARHATKLLPASLLLAGASALIGLPVAMRVAAQTDFQLLFVDVRSWRPLAMGAGLVFLPFLFGSLHVGLVFLLDTERIGRLYAANLVGSATGALAGIGGLFFMPPEQGFAVAASVLALAAGCLVPGGNRLWQSFCAVLFIAGVGLAWTLPQPPLSPYKPISYALQLPDVRLLADRPHPMGRLQVVASPALRYAPGMSLNLREPIPAAAHLFRHGENYGVFLDQPDSLDASVLALPLAFAMPGHALVLHPGGGATVAWLLGAGPMRVDAVEPHPIAARWLRERHPDARLQVSTREGRAFLNAPPHGYDLIALPARGAFGGSVGIQALQEDYLMTREAFQAIWEALNDAGMLAVGVYLDHPPRHSLKTLSLLVETLRRAGVDAPADHLAAVRSWDMLSLVMAKRPMGAMERERLARFSQSMGFDRLWSPGEGTVVEDAFHRLHDERLEAGFAAILGPDVEDFHATYLFDVRAPRDSRPFFNQFLRLGRLAETRRFFGDGSLAFVEMGSLLVALMAVLLALAAAVLILAPLLRLGWRPGGRLAVPAYFAAIGLGFMFLEIVWIQRFILYWGHSLYSAGGVIAALLCGMGVGSALSVRLPATPRSIRRVAVGIVLFIVLSLLLQPRFFSATLAWPEAVKWAVGLLWLGLPAVLLGMPFPLALRTVNRSRPNFVPWAWGINGCFSVLASPLAMLLALHGGFPAVGAAAAGAYLLALGVAGALAISEAASSRRS